MARLTDEDYAEMAADYAANPPTADEIAGEVVIDSTILRTGRPPKSAGGPGKTPTTSVRLPVELRARVERLAAAEDVKPAEIIRRAVSEYVDKRPPAAERRPRPAKKAVSKTQVAKKAQSRAAAARRSPRG
ncbi:RelB-like antitoxin [Gordonia phage Ruthy]|nr:RelB-like antitoxin [Gordonia phage Ruthy]AXH50498.1 RelB-like antitoxin [Gordonia phage Ruthy]